MDKRTLTGFLLVILLLALLAACGSDQPAAGNDDPEIRIITATPRETAIPTATPTPIVPVLDMEDLSGTEINFWYSADPTSPDLMVDLVAQFNSENEYGVSVVATKFDHPDDMSEAVGTVLGTGQSPQVVLAEPYQYLPWVETGRVVDLDPYLGSAAYGLPVEDLFPAILWRDAYIDGRWGFPGLFSAQVMLYNQTWADELGFDSPPETASAFQRQACAAHQANDDHTGGWMIDSSLGGATAWILSFEEYLDQLLDFKSRQVEAAYTFLSDLYSEGCAWYPLEQYPDEDFALRQGLFYAVNTREIGYVSEAFDLIESDDTWIAIAYPNPQGEPLVSLSGESYVVLKSTTPRQVAAWLFIRFMTGEESQITLSEEGLFLPLDGNTADELQENDSLPTAWRDALALLDRGVVEPPIQQWGVLRSVLQDAQEEVMNERFVPGTMSLFLDRLDTLVNELLQ